jgi:hypothetical protein
MLGETEKGAEVLKHILGHRSHEASDGREAPLPTACEFIAALFAILRDRGIHCGPWPANGQEILNEIFTELTGMVDVWKYDFHEFWPLIPYWVQVARGEWHDIFVQACEKALSRS